MKTLPKRFGNELSLTVLIIFPKALPVIRLDWRITPKVFNPTLRLGKIFNVDFGMYGWALTNPSRITTNPVGIVLPDRHCNCNSAGEPKLVRHGHNAIAEFILLLALR